MPTKPSLFCPELCRSSLDLHISNAVSELSQVQDYHESWMKAKCGFSLLPSEGAGTGIPNLALCPAHVSGQWKPPDELLWGQSLTFAKFRNKICARSLQNTETTIKDKKVKYTQWYEEEKQWQQPGTVWNKYLKIKQGPLWKLSVGNMF